MIDALESAAAQIATQDEGIAVSFYTYSSLLQVALSGTTFRHELLAILSYLSCLWRTKIKTCSSILLYKVWFKL